MKRWVGVLLRYPLPPPLVVSHNLKFRTYKVSEISNSLNIYWLVLPKNTWIFYMNYRHNWSVLFHFRFVKFVSHADALNVLEELNGKPPLHLSIVFARKREKNEKENKVSYLICTASDCGLCIVQYWTVF